MARTQKVRAKFPSGKSATSDITVVARGGRRLRLPQTLRAKPREPQPDPKPEAKTPSDEKATAQRVHAKPPPGKDGTAEITTKDQQGKQAGILYVPEATGIHVLFYDGNGDLRWLAWDSATNIGTQGDIIDTPNWATCCVSDEGTYFQGADGIYLRKGDVYTYVDNVTDPILSASKCVNTAAATYWFTPVTVDAEVGETNGTEAWKLDKSTRTKTRIGGFYMQYGPMYALAPGYIDGTYTDIVTDRLTDEVYLVGWRIFWEEILPVGSPPPHSSGFYAYTWELRIAKIEGDALVVKATLYGVPDAVPSGFGSYVAPYTAYMSGNNAVAYNGKIVFTIFRSQKGGSYTVTDSGLYWWSAAAAFQPIIDYSTYANREPLLYDASNLLVANLTNKKMYHTDSVDNWGSVVEINSFPSGSIQALVDIIPGVLFENTAGAFCYWVASPPTVVDTVPV